MLPPSPHGLPTSSCLLSAPHTRPSLLHHHTVLHARWPPRGGRGSSQVAATEAARDPLLSSEHRCQGGSSPPGGQCPRGGQRSDPLRLRLSSENPAGPRPCCGVCRPLHHVLDRKAQGDPEGPAAREGRWREARRLSRRSAGTRRAAARDLPPGSVPGAEGPVTAPLAPARLSPPPAPPRRAPARPLAARSPAPRCRHHFRTAVSVTSPTCASRQRMGSGSGLWAGPGRDFLTPPTSLAPPTSEAGAGPPASGGNRRTRVFLS